MLRIPGYGRGPLHLLGIILCYGLVAYAGARFLDLRPWLIFLAFVGGVVLHDFVVFPLYVVADRWLRKLLRSRKQRVPWINHVRFPVVISFTLLLFYFPLILRLADERPEFTGLSIDSYLYRWLAVSAVLFASSALLYGYRWVRSK